MPGTTLTSHASPFTCIHLLLQLFGAVLWGRHYYWHFTDEETEAPRGEGIDPSPITSKWQSRFKPKQHGSRSFCQSGPLFLWSFQAKQNNIPWNHCSRQTLASWISSLSPSDKPVYDIFLSKTSFQTAFSEVSKTSWGPGAGLWKGLAFPLVLRGHPWAGTASPLPCSRNPGSERCHCTACMWDCEWVQPSLDLGTDSGRSDSARWIEGHCQCSGT